MDPNDPVINRSLEDITALLDAFFAAVSFEPGGRPDYGAIHDLFISDGLLIRNSGSAPDVCTVDRFIEPRQQLVDDGVLTAFWESEIAGATEIFGNVAHRFSTYDKQGTSDGKVTATLGVISTQFVRTPIGWRISSMAWDDERAGLTVPVRYRAS